VVWMDHWSTGVYVYARYTRSTNGGASFETLKSVSATYGVDGVSVAADGNGHVNVFWHTMVPVQSTIPQATWLHTVRSANNGVSFSADTNVVITNLSALACSMCMTRARFAADGSVNVVFRSAENNIRDFYVLKGNATSNNFTAIRVNTDNWYIDYCPMVGPELEPCKGDKQLCAFMSGGHVYWAVSDSGLTAFSLHVATPLNEADELFPTAVENNAGQVLFVWQVGPMSVTDSATVKWALYNINGTYAGQQGTVGRTFSGTKTTAYVGTDNNFYIVTTADILTAIHPVETVSAINIFPNPAKDKLTITGLEGKTNIKLFDAAGNLVVELNAGNSTDMDVSKLAAGDYTLLLDNGKQSVVKKVLIGK